MRAVSVGSVVPPSFCGQIHSVFEHAVNVQVAGSETLLTVFASETTDLPQGIRVSPTGLWTQPLSPRQAVKRQGGRLDLGEAGISIELSGAPVYHGTLQGICPDRMTLNRRLAWVEQNLRALEGSHPGPLEKRISAALSQLTEAVRIRDREGIQHSTADLVGLGPGLTPSGDDILVGFSAGLRCTARNKNSEFLFRALQANAARTNDISRTYLLLAARGLYSSSLRTLCQAICADRNSYSAISRSFLEKSAQVVLHTGHTSGRDTVRGLLAGFEVWLLGILIPLDRR